VRELLRRRVVSVAKAQRAGERLDGRLVAGQEVEALFGAGPAVALDVAVLLLQRQLRRLARIEADGQHIELLAGIEVDGLEPAHQAIENLRAKHRAAVVDRRDDHRARGEELGEAYVAPGL